MQGGISSGYKKFVEEKGLKDETYCADGVALIRISGTAVHNNKTLQVDAVFLTSTCSYKYIDFHSRKLISILNILSQWEKVGNNT